MLQTCVEFMAVTKARWFERGEAFTCKRAVFLVFGIFIDLPPSLGRRRRIGGGWLFSTFYTLLHL